MVSLLLDSAQLEVSLSVSERTLMLQKESSLVIQRSDIKKAQLTDDPWTWLRGVRSPGIHIPGVLAAGTWRSSFGKDFVLIRKRKPGVVIDLSNDAPVQRFILTTRHGEALMKALRVDTESAPRTDVIDIIAAQPDT